MSFFVIAGLALQAGASVAPPAPPPSDFDFRGARLGMTLEEFEALPPLGTPRLSNRGVRGARRDDNLLTLCQADTERINAQIGIVQCQRAGDDPFAQGHGRYVYTRIQYSFGPDETGVKRLFGILLITGRENTGEAFSALQQRWGAGQSSQTPVTNGLGNTLQMTTTRWGNVTGAIKYESMCGNVTTICVTYTHTNLSESLAGRRRGIAGTAADRF